MPRWLTKMTSRSAFMPPATTPGALSVPAPPGPPARNTIGSGLRRRGGGLHPRDENADRAPARHAPVLAHGEVAATVVRPRGRPRARRESSEPDRARTGRPAIPAAGYCRIPSAHPPSKPSALASATRPRIRGPRLRTIASQGHLSMCRLRDHGLRLLANVRARETITRRCGHARDASGNDRAFAAVDRCGCWPALRPIFRPISVVRDHASCRSHPRTSRTASSGANARPSASRAAKPALSIACRARAISGARDASSAGSRRSPCCFELRLRRAVDARRPGPIALVRREARGHGQQLLRLLRARMLVDEFEHLAQHAPGAVPGIAVEMHAREIEQRDRDGVASADLPRKRQRLLVHRLGSVEVAGGRAGLRQAVQRLLEPVPVADAA